MYELIKGKKRLRYNAKDEYNEDGTLKRTLVTLPNEMRFRYARFLSIEELERLQETDYFFAELTENEAFRREYASQNGVQVMQSQFEEMLNKIKPDSDVFDLFFKWAIPAAQVGVAMTSMDETIWNALQRFDDAIKRKKRDMYYL
jgi:hypothetical protein